VCKKCFTGSNKGFSNVGQRRIILIIYETDICGVMNKYPNWLKSDTTVLSTAVVYPGILFGGGGQQIQLRTEDRENGDLGVVAP
jgi:hypothetical protein